MTTIINVIVLAAGHTWNEGKGPFLH